MDGFLACLTFWSAVLQFEQFHGPISHITAVKRCVMNCSKLVLNIFAVHIIGSVFTHAVTGQLIPYSANIEVVFFRCAERPIKTHSVSKHNIQDS